MSQKILCKPFQEGSGCPGKKRSRCDCLHSTLDQLQTFKKCWYKAHRLSMSQGLKARQSLILFYDVRKPTENFSFGCFCSFLSGSFVKRPDRSFETYKLHSSHGLFQSAVCSAVEDVSLRAEPGQQLYLLTSPRQSHQPAAEADTELECAILHHKLASKARCTVWTRCPPVLPGPL